MLGKRVESDNGKGLIGKGKLIGYKSNGVRYGDTSGGLQSGARSSARLYA
jgi:hypothetical protein|eukprot:SAG25_NODE_902_length_4852_cov_3.306964_2_plen_50_part_00